MVRHHHHTFLEHLADLSLKPETGIPLAIFVAFLSFAVIRFIGESLIGYLFDPLFDKVWGPLVSGLSGMLGPGSFWHWAVGKWGD